MKIESKFSVIVTTLSLFKNVNKKKFMFGKLFSRKMFRWCLTFDAVYAWKLPGYHYMYVCGHGDKSDFTSDNFRLISY